MRMRSRKNHSAGLFAHDIRATIAIATRKMSRTPWLNEEPAASPEAAVKETVAKISSAKVMQIDNRSGPNPCAGCFHTQRETLITIVRRIRKSMTVSAIPMAAGFYALRREECKPQPIGT